MTSTAAVQIDLLRSNKWVPLVKPTKLSDQDLPRIGHKIGVGEDAIHAVLDVEAPRGGYDALGRLVILYEPHVAYRAAPSAEIRATLVEAGLAYKSWGERPYPKDSYARFDAAFAIHPETAIKACSLGRGQLLGENFVVCGYSSPVEMYVKLTTGGEVEHLEAMVRFIKGNHLDDELRNKNWAGFARGYNGSGYKKNAYDTKLAARYAWWAARPDTPWSPSETSTVLIPPVVPPGIPQPETPLAPVEVAATPVSAPVVTVQEPPQVVPVPAPTSPEVVPATPSPALPIPGTPSEAIVPVVVPRRGFVNWFGGIIDAIFYTR